MESSIRIANGSSEGIEVWLEPWGDSVPLAGGGTLRIVATATEEGQFEVVWRAGDVTVYAWPTASVRVYALDDSEVKPGSFASPVPQVPPGASVRSFLGVVLGEERSR